MGRSERGPRRRLQHWLRHVLLGISEGLHRHRQTGQNWRRTWQLLQFLKLHLGPSCLSISARPCRDQRFNAMPKFLQKMASGNNLWFCFCHAAMHHTYCLLCCLDVSIVVCTTCILSCKIFPNDYCVQAMDRWRIRCYCVASCVFAKKPWNPAKVESSRARAEAAHVSDDSFKYFLINLIWHLVSFITHDFHKILAKAPKNEETESYWWSSLLGRWMWHHCYWKHCCLSPSLGWKQSTASLPSGTISHLIQLWRRYVLLLW